MNFNIEFLSHQITRALGWSLLHSLWQGAVVALVLGLLLLLLNRYSAKLLYFLSIGSLGVVLGLFVITFLYLYLQGSDSTMEAGVQATSVSVVEKSTIMLTEAEASFLERMLVWSEQYLNQYVPFLVSLWLIGLLLMSLRFLGGLAYVQRLRKYRLAPLETEWQEALNGLSKRMGITKAVKLAESAMVQVPMVVGYLKPVILVPIGAITGLSQHQVEAILAHELAHIRRHDYLLNLLQQAVETIFFFHPAVWWLSGVINTEREHCCDDMAAKACGDTLVYVQALAQLEELHLSAAPYYTLAITGNKGSLLCRVKRLVEKQPLRSSFKEGFTAAIVIMAGFMTLSFSAWTGLSEAQQQMLDSDEIHLLSENQSDKPVPLAGRETEKALSATTLTLSDTSGVESQLVIIKNQKGDIAELYVNGRQIPQKDIPEFKEKIQQHLRFTQNAQRMGQEEKESLKSAVPNTLPKVGGSVSPVDKVKNEETKTGEPSKGKVTIASVSSQIINKSPSVITGTGIVESSQSTFSASSSKKGSEEIASVSSEQAQSIKGEGRRTVSQQKHEKKHDKILNELKREGLLEKEADEYELHIDQDAFYINGEKQAQQDYQKYKKLLLGDSIEGLESYSINIKRHKHKN